MRTLFDGDVHVHYRFIYLLPFDTDDPEFFEAHGGQANGLCGAGAPGVLSMITGTHTGNVPVRVELHDEAPAVDEQWEDVVEVSLAAAPEVYWLTAFDWGEEIGTISAGSYRARWCATRMDEGYDGARTDEDPETDRYLLQLWPAPPAPDAVVRQGSDCAAYWHGVAATADAPPPPPTPEVLAEQTAEAERARQAAEAAWEARIETEVWGGRAPTAQLRAVGGRAAQLSGLDRELVDLLVAMPARQQRHLAVEAARHACDLAGVGDVALVQQALAAARDGAPLPLPWGDWSATWDALVPPGDQTGDELVAEVQLVLTLGGDRPVLAPEATAIDAVLAAGESDPARAVVGAVDAVARGQRDPRTVLDQVRRHLADGAPPFG